MTPHKSFLQPLPLPEEKERLILPQPHHISEALLASLKRLGITPDEVWRASEEGVSDKHAQAA